MSWRKHHLYNVCIYIRVCQGGCLQSVCMFIIQHVCKSISESVSLIRYVLENVLICISGLCSLFAGDSL